MIVRQFLESSMSQNVQPPVDPTAVTHLLREVSVPAFMAKVAADTGHSPADDAEGDRLLSLGDMVCGAVDSFLQKRAAAAAGTRVEAVKSAVDDGFAAVFGRTSPSTAPAADSFLAAPGVRDAAASILGRTAPATGG